MNEELRSEEDQASVLSMQNKTHETGSKKSSFFNKAGSSIVLFFSRILSAIGTRVHDYFVQLKDARGIRKLAVINRGMSPRWLALPLPVIFFVTMFVLSSLVISLETVQFHLLLVITNYLQATTIIAIAMFGIALGGLVSFYLGKIPPLPVLFFATAGVFLSVMYSYFYLVSTAGYTIPYMLVLPFFFASVVISTIFSNSHSNFIYFTNLIGSAAGVLIPILFLPVLKSEGIIIALLYVPAGLAVLFALGIRNIPLKIIVLIGAVNLLLLVNGFLNHNNQMPVEISSELMESKILAAAGEADKKNYSINYCELFFNKVYALDDTGEFYIFAGDETDRERVFRYLGMLGYVNRWNIPFWGQFNKTINIEDNKIPADYYDQYILPDLKERFSFRADKNYDRLFLDKVYQKTDNGNYIFTGDDYALNRARLLLAEMGFWDFLDINIDMQNNGAFDDRMKIFNQNHRVLLSEDSMLGRVEYTGDDEYMMMAVNGVYLDGIDSYNGAAWDPRVPRVAFQENPNIFIVGLSADGIVKSCKRIPGATVEGIEINPTILRTMQEGPFAEFAHMPYEDVKVHAGEGRSFLENNPGKYEIISLMNIHMEHGPVSSLSPENFHTVEATDLLLNRLSDTGLIVYEEIILNTRSDLAFYKLLNTIKETLIRRGVEDPSRHIHIFQWDFSQGGSAFRTLSVKRTPFTEAEAKDMESYVRTLSAIKSYHNVETTYTPYKDLESRLDDFIRGEMQVERIQLPVNLSAQEFTKQITQKIQDPDDLEFLLKKYTYTRYDRYWLNPDSLKEHERSRLTRILETINYPMKIDLKPVIDDSPFPFNVYANRFEAWGIFRMVLIMSLLMIIPVLLLLLNSRGTYRLSPALPFLFAAVTGLGYMLVEIVLMQRFQLFIGDYNFTLIVILGGLLLFSGIGSFVSRFFNRITLTISIAFIPILLIASMLWLDDIFILLAGLEFNQKLLASAGIIFPLTFLMGIPFPNAMAALKKHTSPEFGALLFGVSGGFSTIGSSLAFLMNVSRGFSFTFLFGSACYTLGLLLFWLILTKASRLGGHR